MPFDGIVTANVVNDLNSLLEGGKIDKVYQPEHDEIVLSVHRGREKHKVFITSNSSDARIQMISEMPPNPVSPPA
ncbi:MAG: NFACT family protein, partial [Bacillota bacterium]|nr:NFACT family protein [Bacillota bacterium]